MNKLPVRVAYFKNSATTKSVVVDGSNLLPFNFGEHKTTNVVDRGKDITTAHLSDKELADLRQLDAANGWTLALELR